MEWTVVFGQAPGKIATVQIATTSRTFIFHLSKLCPHRQRHRLPAGLQRLLADPNVQKLGVNIAPDVKKLSRDYDEVSVKGTVDISKMAKDKCLPLERPSHLPSLWTMCRCLLQKDIAKPVNIIISDWDR